MKIIPIIIFLAYSSIMCAQTNDEIIIIKHGSQKYPIENADAPDYNIDKDILAVKGYDLTEYYTHNRALRGSSKHQYQYKGVKFFFLNENNKSIFIANPEKYLPEYGGYCADKMGAIFIGGTKPGKHDSNPEYFMIIDDKLYLFSYKSELYFKRWRENKKNNIEKADKTWELMNHKN
ncbi:YHS domain-containing (seleno)protein [Confluentibacter sediminis]|uniref:YHS domain-containing (seleno)protein n=1 Tax=Confluentibacter sediminis TaxID=2219045 RepID=UPI000DADD0E4|nr:YHS domain-containing (seleno)protein [Confluentibacter sediminis]